MISWKIVWSSPAHFCKACLVSPAAARHLPDFFLSVLVLPLLWGANKDISLGNLKLLCATVSPQDSRDASQLQTSLKCWQDWILLQKSSSWARGGSWRATLSTSATAEVSGEWRVDGNSCREAVSSSLLPSKARASHVLHQAPGWLSRALALTKAAAGAWTHSGFTSSLLP